MLTTVVASVSTAQSSKIDSLDADLVAGLEAFPVAEWASLGTLTGTKNTIRGNVLVADYELAVIASYGPVEAAGKTHAIYAFGSAAKVLDFKGIASSLLEADLNELKAALAEDGSPEAAERLRGRLATFLESEVNLALAEGEWAGPGASAQELRSARVVDAAFETSATQALVQALGRLQRHGLSPRLKKAALWCAPLAACLPILGFKYPAYWGVVVAWMLAQAAYGYQLVAVRHEAVEAFPAALRGRLLGVLKNGVPSGAYWWKFNFLLLAWSALPVAAVLYFSIPAKLAPWLARLFT